MDERDSLQLQLAQLQKQLSAKNEETEDFSKLVAAAAMQARLAGDWAELRRRLKRRANALSLRAETFSERPGCVQCLSVKNELEAKAALLQDCFSKLSGTHWRRPALRVRLPSARSALDMCVRRMQRGATFLRILLSRATAPRRGWHLFACHRPSATETAATSSARSARRGPARLLPLMLAPAVPPRTNPTAAGRGLGGMQTNPFVRD